MSDVTQTTRQDLPVRAQSYGNAGLQLLYELLLNPPAPDKNGITNWFKRDPGAGKGENGTILDTSGGLKSYEDLYGPDALQPQLEGFNGLENTGRTLAINSLKGGQPIRNAADQWMLDQIGGGDPNAIDTSSDIAKMNGIYTMGGPLAGASRTGLLDMLMGTNQKSAGQSLLDTMSGKNAHSAENELAGYLGPQSNISRDAAFDTIGGDLAGTARRSSMDTISGRHLSPNSDPYLKATGDAALKATADAFKYGTAPEMMGHFANTGTYGGSAHQQTMQMKGFDLAKALGDQANEIYGGNYAKERDRQLGETNSERGFSQSALESERGRDYGAMDSSLQREIQAALDERSGTRGLLDSTANRGLQASEGELNRGVSTMGLLPQLMASRYQDADVLRGLGTEQRQIDDANNRVKYENAITKAQFPFNLLNIFSAGLGGFTGGQGVTTTTSANPNSTSPVATGVGGTLAGVGALAGLNDIGRNNGWWGSTPAPVK